MLDELRDRHHRVCSRDEHIALCTAFQAGDEQAFNTIVRTNLGLIWMRVHRWTFAIPEEDAFQEGVLGLRTAALKFDRHYGEFSTYAVRWIDQAIIRYANNWTFLSAVRLPVHKYKQETVFQPKPWTSRMHKADISIEAKTDPIDEAAERRCTLRVLDQLRDDKPLSEELVFARSERDFAKLTVHAALAKLEPERRWIIELHYLNERRLTLEGIAKRLNGITRERVRQIEKVALKQMAQTLLGRELDPIEVLELIDRIRTWFPALHEVHEVPQQPKPTPAPAEPGETMRVEGKTEKTEEKSAGPEVVSAAVKLAAQIGALLEKGYRFESKDGSPLATLGGVLAELSFNNGVVGIIPPPVAALITATELCNIKL